MHVLNN
jgi:hypothetical protein